MCRNIDRESLTGDLPLKVVIRIIDVRNPIRHDT